MLVLQCSGGGQETFLPLLHGAQAYLEELLHRKVPDSVVAAAWDDFYRVYDDLIRRFVAAQGVPRCDIDDCVQEVWGEVAARLWEFNRPADRPGLRAWLYSLVRSKATNVFRKRSRLPSESLDERMSGGLEPGDSQADPAVMLEQQWEQTLMDTVIAQLREELSPTNVRLLQMRLIERRRVEEVATELSLEPEQVYARQHRILKKLRARVALYSGGSLGADGLS